MMAGVFLLGFGLATALWWTWARPGRTRAPSYTRATVGPPAYLGYMKIGDSRAEISSLKLVNGKYRTEAMFRFPPHEYGPITLLDTSGTTVSVGTKIMEIGEDPRCHYNVTYEQEVLYQMLPDGSSVPAK